MWKYWLLLFILVSYGCTQVNRQISKRVMPPLPPTPLQVPTQLSGVARLATTQPPSLALTWTNPPSALASYLIDDIKGTQDFTNWYKVGSLPYSVSNWFPLVGRPTNWEFYVVEQQWK